MQLFVCIHTYTHMLCILVFGVSSVLNVAGVWLLTLFPGICLCHYLAVGDVHVHHPLTSDCGCGYSQVGIVPASPVQPL